jgi:hypothetical protein
LSNLWLVSENYYYGKMKRENQRFNKGVSSFGFNKPKFAKYGFMLSLFPEAVINLTRIRFFKRLYGKNRTVKLFIQDKS